jgi:hypothetical protein
MVTEVGFAERLNVTVSLDGVRAFIRNRAQGCQSACRRSSSSLPNIPQRTESDIRAKTSRRRKRQEGGSAAGRASAHQARAGQFKMTGTLTSNDWRNNKKKTRNHC